MIARNPILEVGRVLAAISLALLWFGANAAAETWEDYGPEDGRFRVAFPAEPELTYHEADSSFGSAYETRLTLRTEEGVLIAQSHDLPPLAVALIPDRILLSRALAGVIESDHGIPLTSRALSGEGAFAREFTYRLPGEPPRFRRARAFLDGGRLYLLLGTTSDPEGPAPRVERFFASFRFWKEGEEPPHSNDSRGMP